jgi:hypothetical protein
MTSEIPPTGVTGIPARALVVIIGFPLGPMDAPGSTRTTSKGMRAGQEPALERMDLFWSGEPGGTRTQKAH